MRKFSTWFLAADDCVHRPNVEDGAKVDYLGSAACVGNCCCEKFQTFGNWKSMCLRFFQPRNWSNLWTTDGWTFLKSGSETTFTLSRKFRLSDSHCCLLMSLLIDEVSLVYQWIGSAKWALKLRASSPTDKTSRSIIRPTCNNLRPPLGDHLGISWISLKLELLLALSSVRKLYKPCEI